MNKNPANNPPDNHRFVLTTNDENVSISHYDGEILDWWFSFVPEKNISEPDFCVEWWWELPEWAQSMCYPRLIIFVMKLALVSHRVKSWLYSRVMPEVRK